MRTVSYTTALYEAQGYCQKERVEAFNEAWRVAKEAELTVHVQLYINNSKPTFAKKMLELYKKDAKFPYLIQDLGKIDHMTNIKKEYKMDAWPELRMLDEKGGFEKLDEKEYGYEVMDVRVRDIFRLLGHVFNIGIEASLALNHDFYGILSGDQILPANHPATMVDFLDGHENAGLVSSLCFFDHSKKEVVSKGVVKTYMVPLIVFRQREGETEVQRTLREAWVLANLLPHEENGWKGLEYVDVDAVGTGGAIIPRKVFTQLKFNEEEFKGEGEDIAFCLDIRRKLGLKVFIVPSIVIENRYPYGAKY